MSDLLIRGIEMPEHCSKCEWRDAESGGECELMIGNPFETFKEQFEHCPFRMISKRHHFVTVPPHGDLVDLSSPFVAQYYDEMKEEWMEKSVTVGDALHDCMVWGMPPTIIPAEPFNNLSKPCNTEAAP